VSAKILPFRARDTRDNLVLAHLALVKRIARKLQRQLPPNFELDDLEQCGMLGLLDAASQFDPARFPGVRFSTYAHRRIEGQIKDWVGMHTAETKRNSRRRRWEESTRPPIAECENWLHGSIPAEGNERQQKCATTADPHARADDAIERRQLRDLIREGLASLPARQAKIIELHYGPDDVGLGEIARTQDLRVGPKRVCQLHQDGLERLRLFYSLRGLKKAA